MLDSIGGVLAAKVLNLFLQKQGQPYDRRGRHIGLPHVRARDREARHQADCTNHLPMHAVGANVAGQIASIVAGGVILGFFK